MRRVCLCLLMVALPVHWAAAETAELVPSNTYALIVGVLKWEERSLATYPSEQRQDVAFCQQLRQLGVPEQNMTLLLDGEATRREIDKSLTQLAKRARPESTLIVYYAGHGMYCKDQGVFANFDIRTGELEETGWCHDDLAETIVSHFHGTRVLLLADCCFSGALDRVARQLHAAGLKAGMITSAAASGTSTNNWTFTMALVDVLKGQPLADLDQDGAISVAEASAEVRGAMEFFERQPSGSALHGLADDFRLVIAAAPNADEEQFVDYRPGEYVQAKDQGKWRPARLIDRGDDTYTVRFQQYNRYRVETVPLADVRPARDVTLVSEKPAELSDQQALQKASVGGKYSSLLKKISVPADFGVVGQFYEWGAWNGTEWGGHTDLPVGYWVYVYPNWYIWGQTGEPEPEHDPPPLAVAIHRPVVPRSFPSFDPRQLTGEPDTPHAGDYGTCWAAAEMDGGREWLELRYGSDVMASSVWVYENMAPGAVYQITGFIDGEEEQLWRGTDPTPRAAEKGISKIKLKTTAPLRRIRVYLNCKGVTGWNEIDAVGLQDANGKIHWAVDASASSSYGQGKTEPFVDPFMSPELLVQETMSALEAELKAVSSRINALTNRLDQERATLQELQRSVEALKAKLR